MQYCQNKLFLLHDVRNDIEIFKQIVSIKKRSEIFLKRDNITVHTILCLNSHESSPISPILFLSKQWKFTFHRILLAFYIDLDIRYRVGRNHGGSKGHEVERLGIALIPS